VKSTAVQHARGRFAFALSRPQKAFITIAFAIIALLMTVTVASALHQHAYWWSPIHYQSDCETQADASIEHDHDVSQPYPYIEVSTHDDYWDYNCVEMVAARSFIAYYGSYYDSWEIGDWWAISDFSVPGCPSCFYWGQGEYTIKYQGAWTYYYWYSTTLWP
jgi:hypothetical protein